MYRYMYMYMYIYIFCTSDMRTYCTTRISFQGYIYRVYVYIHNVREREENTV